MASTFTHNLLVKGRVRLSAKPNLEPTDADHEAMQSALAAAMLQLPGPRLPQALDTLVRAVQVVYRSGWRLLNAEPTPPGEDLTLRMPAAPRNPQEHLAGDVALRFLPGLYHRALGRDPEDPLARVMRDVLRQWPLSGVLADISEPPTAPIDFGCHAGLGFLYAERLAARERPAWLPRGPARDALEVVYETLGKSCPFVAGYPKRCLDP